MSNNANKTSKAINTITAVNESGNTPTPSYRPTSPPPKTTKKN